MMDGGGTSSVWDSVWGCLLASPRNTKIIQTNINKKVHYLVKAKITRGGSRLSACEEARQLTEAGDALRMDSHPACWLLSIILVKLHHRPG